MATSDFRACIEWAEESFEECARYEDHGYDSCDAWDDRCCDWWPCSWGCKLITWVCLAWTWISNIVCVLWTMATATVCVTWEIGSTVLTPVGIVIEGILSIPIIGRFIGEVLEIASEIVLRLAAVPDIILSVLGLEPLKKVRLCIIILKDKNGVPTTTSLVVRPAVDEAVRVLREEGNILVIEEGIHEVSDPSPSYALDVQCNVDAWGEDLWLAGSYFERTAAWYAPIDAVSRTTGVGSPIVVFCVRTVSGQAAGCAGLANDYLTIEGSNPICLAHEISHKLALWHCCGARNLAYPTCGGVQLKKWQRVIARNSKYVTYV